MKSTAKIFKNGFCHDVQPEKDFRLKDTGVSIREESKI